MTDKHQYPKRPSFFALKFVRLLLEQRVANELGADAFVLLSAIALTEDTTRYRKAVTFFNGQLMPLIGVGSEHTLIKVRSSAVDAGWLHYEPGGKGIAGRYWVTVPGGLDLLPDTVEENVSDNSFTVSPANNAVEVTGEVQGKQQDKCSGTVSPANNAVEVTGEVQRKCQSFLPSPIPVPIPSPPSAERALPPPERTKPKKPASGKKPRQPNPLFDAVAQVTGSSPARQGPAINKVVTALRGDNPPFTPAEVLEFGARFGEFVPEAATWTVPMTRPTLGVLQKYIGRLREPPPASRPPPRSKADRAQEQLEREFEACFGTQPLSPRRSTVVYDPPPPRPTSPLTERLIPPNADVPKETTTEDSL